MGGGALIGDFEGFFYFDIPIWVPFLDPEDTENLSCGIEDETSVHVLCECEALASLRLTYLGSSFLDPEDIRELVMGAIWNFAKETGLL
jgi:hypothetical protein